MRALHLGWVTNSLKTILDLRHAGIAAVVVNTDPTHFFDKVPALPTNLPVALNLYQNIKIPKLRLFRFFSTMSPRVLGLPFRRRLPSLLKEQNVDFVFAHWGVGILPEIALIKSIAPDLPVILNMETFPTAPSGQLREMMELRVFQRMAKCLDGLIIPTQEMADVILKLVPLIKEKPCWIKPMHYPEEYAPQELLPKLSQLDNQPHVVFVGQFDFKHSVNDVRSELLSLARAGIVVHCAAVDGLHHQNILPFEPFNGAALVSGALTTFMTQFDACLATYNLPKESYRLRFQTSLPARFLIGLVAGLPIVLPRGEFRAMESFIGREDVGFAFRKVEELYSSLINHDWKELQERSRLRQKDFLFDSQEFLRFVNVILQGKRR